MKKIAWITDSTCLLPQEVREQYHIYVLPNRIQFGQESFRDGVDLSEEEFYARLKEAKTLPTTSQPAIGETVELFETLKETYDLAIAVHVSSELSGTLNATRQAAEIADFPLFAVDSKLISLPMFEMIQKGNELLKQGAIPEEVADYLSHMHTHAHLYVTVGSLEQLHKGGRVSSIQLFMGSLLQVKPILTITNGKLEAFDKVRSRKKALTQLVSLFQEELSKGVSIEQVTILHAFAEEDARFLREKLHELAPQVAVKEGSLGAAIGVHAGEETIGMFWFNQK